MRFANRRGRPVRLLLVTFVLVLLCSLSYADSRYKITVPVEKEAIVTDHDTGLQWALDFVKNVNWNEAHAYCEKLDHGDADDWRLPTKYDLMGLIDEPGNFPVTEFPKMPEKVFWSDTPKEDSEKHAFYVDFYNGFIDFDYKGNRYYARCVRGEENLDLE